MGYDTNSDGFEVFWEGNEIAGSGGRTQTNYYRYPDGSVAHLHYPGGHYIRHDYTARGQLAATGWDDDENNWWMKLAAYTYLADGKVDHEDYGNGTTAALTYDGRGFVNTVQQKWTAGGNLFASRIYTHDTRDRILSIQKGNNPGSNPMENGRGDRFRYDEEGQLVEGWYNAADPANSGAGNTRYDGFSYDALGNRGQGNYVASRGQMDFTKKDNGLNQYRAWWPYSDTKYDDDLTGWGSPGQANGVLMQDGWITAGFNALNQPMYIWSPTYNGTANWMYFGYDPLGRCVKRWVGDSGDIYSNPATYFHYDGWDLLQEGANAWGPARVYVQGNRVDEVVWSYNTFTGEQAFHHYDARGHCTLLTDSVGNILEQYEYDAFGQPYFYDANGNSIGAYDPVQNLWEGYSQFGNRFLFTGREWIPDLKLYDFRNRMYQPELGRFLQPDPKGFGAGDYNLYRYCHNDPVNNSDPTGLQETQNGDPKCLNPLTSTGGGDWDFFNGRVAEAMAESHTQTNVSPSAPQPIEQAGRLAVDTDGTGANPSDPTSDSNIPAGVDANGNIVPRYLDNGKGAVNPAMVRPLNADTDSFAVAPKQYAPANEGAKTGGVIIPPGSRATGTLSDGRVMESRVGDYGPEGKVGEFSSKAFRDHGIQLINIKGVGPAPSLDGRTTPDIPVIMRYYPSP